MSIFIRRSSDTDAPVLNRTLGIAIPWCQGVIEGVGGFPAITGWTAPFGFDTTDHRTVLRNSTANGGTGMYFHIEDSDSSLPGQFALRGFESISGLDLSLGINGFPGTLDEGYLRVEKSTSSNTTPKDWILIGDPHTLYLFVKSDSSSSYYWFPYIIGDYQTLAVNHAPWSAIIAGNEVETRNKEARSTNFKFYGRSKSESLSSYKNFYTPRRSADQSYGPYGIVGVMYPGDSAGLAGGANNGFEYHDVPWIKRMMFDILLGGDGRCPALSRGPFGRLRGIKGLPFRRSDTPAPDSDFPDQLQYVAPDGTEYLGLRISSTGYVYVQTSGDWGPLI